jgi:hypothetical protein
MKNVRKRFWVTAGLAVASVALFVVTIITPDWIEAVFRVDPDGGSGAVEWLIAAGLALVAATTCAVSVAELRRTPAEVTS